MSRFVRPSKAELEKAYRAMAADTQHEREALEWSEALIGDAFIEDDEEPEQIDR